MTRPDRDDLEKPAWDVGEDEACGSGRPRSRGSHMLDRIAEALGVSAALLRNPEDGKEPSSGGTVKLMEAAELLNAFMRIEDPQARRRCLTYVQDEIIVSRGAARLPPSPGRTD